MQSRYFFLTIMIFILTFCGFGCKSDSPDLQFMKLIPTTDVNKTIKLILPDYYVESDEAPGLVDLEIVNNSKELLRFPLDFGIRLFTYDANTGEWAELDNLITHKIIEAGMDPESARKKLEQEGGEPLYPKGSSFEKSSSRPITIYPDIGGRNLPLTVRVLIVGTIFRNDLPTDEMVAAYYDVVINP